MKILVDEHIPLRTVQALPMMGHDVRDIRLGVCRRLDEPSAIPTTQDKAK